MIGSLSRTLAFPLLCAAAFGQDGTEEAVVDPMELQFRWNNGLEFETADERFRGHLGLWILQDWAFGSQAGEVDDDKGAFVDGSELRAARFYSFGTIYGSIDYRAAYEFEGGDAEFLDVFLDFRGVGPTSVRIGHGFEPFGQESITPLNQLNFAERSLPSAFTPLRNTGVMAHGNFSERQSASYGLGVFRSTDRFGNDSETGNVAADDGEYSLTGRVTWAPELDSASALHLGLSASHRRSEDDLVRFRAGTESRQSPILVDTGAIDADSSNLFGLEAGFQHGPWLLSGEAVRAEVDANDGSDPAFDAATVQLTYSLTGERRRYDPEGGRFLPLQVESPWEGPGTGGGAWELALRWSTIDLDDGALLGGKLNNATAGVCWFPNASLRALVQYTLGDLDDDSSEGRSESLLFRLQLVL